MGFARTRLLNIGALMAFGVAGTLSSAAAAPEPFADAPPLLSAGYSAGNGPIHKRGRFKRNARLQKGRKTLPRSRK